MNFNNNHLNYSRVATGLFVLFAIFFGMWIGSILFDGETKNVTQEKKPGQTIEDPFNAIHLRARAAIVYDILRDRVLYGENHETQLPLASLTKLMTALIAEETLGGDHVISVSARAIEEEGDTGLSLGEEWSVDDLIDLTLLTSSNDGAYALAEAVKIKTENTLPHSNTLGAGVLVSDLMNRRGVGLSLAQTFFLNISGLDSSLGTSGAYGSARDVSKLLAYIYKTHPTLLEKTRYARVSITSQSGLVHDLENTNKEVESIPGIVASKTGFTDLAGGNLAIIFEAGPMHPIAVVVLGSTQEERFRDAEKLVWAALEYSFLRKN